MTVFEPIEIAGADPNAASFVSVSIVAASIDALGFAVANRTPLAVILRWNLRSGRSGDHRGHEDGEAEHRRGVFHGHLILRIGQHSVGRDSAGFLVRRAHGGIAAMTRIL